MDKKIKVIELLQMKAENKNMPRKIYLREYEYQYHNDNRGQGYYRSVYGGNYIALTTDFQILEILNSEIEVEILEDEKEIDIQGIEELKNTEIVYDVTLECEHEVNKTISNVDISKKINEILKAVKQLDKKINKEE